MYNNNTFLEFFIESVGPVMYNFNVKLVGHWVMYMKVGWNKVNHLGGHILSMKNLL